MASTGEVWKLGRRPALDGVRGIAILFVLFAHIGIPGMVGASIVGVTMFFALSGFLITTLLLEEHTRAGHIGLRGFYWRRAVRLAPALLVVVAFFYTLGLATFRDIWPALAYVANWDRIGGHVSLLTHTWSLSVEEQFYLAWPLLVVLFKARRNLLIGVASAVVCLSTVARNVIVDSPADGRHRVYFGTDTRADALMIGCLLALMMHGDREREGRPNVAATLAVLTAALSFTFGRFSVAITPSLVAVGTAATLAFASQGAGPRILTHPVLVYLGQRSYGIYLWHAPFVWLPFVFVDGRWRFLAVVVAIGFAELSWRVVEQPTQRRLRHLVDGQAASRSEVRPAHTVAQ